MENKKERHPKTDAHSGKRNAHRPNNRGQRGQPRASAETDIPARHLEPVASSSNAGPDFRQKPTPEGSKELPIGFKPMNKVPKREQEKKTVTNGTKTDSPPLSVSRKTLASSTLATCPSLDSLPQVVEHQKGRRKGQSKGGKSGKNSGLIARSEAESSAKEAGTRDAERALQQQVYELVTDAILDWNSPYLTQETREGYWNFLEGLNAAPIQDAALDAAPSAEPGEPENAPALALELNPLPVCTSAMRDVHACADPWRFSMAMVHDRPGWFATAAVESLKHFFPTLRTSEFLHRAFSGKIVSLTKNLMVTGLMTISFKWLTARMTNPLPSWLSTVVTKGTVSVGDIIAVRGLLAKCGVHAVGALLRSVPKIVPAVPAAIAAFSLGKFVYDLATGEHTTLVKYSVSRLEDDAGCISAACNEHRDVRSLTSGKVERSKCGCFSKVCVTSHYCTFGVMTSRSREVYISDEVFANICSMDMLRPGLTLEENIKRLRNSVGLSHYVNLNRGDKQQSLAATFWLAELKITSEWREHRALLESSEQQLE